MDSFRQKILTITKFGKFLTRFLQSSKKLTKKFIVFYLGFFKLKMVGYGRIIGDKGISYYIQDLMVLPIAEI